MSSVQCYCSETKRKERVSCPAVIYKSDMLVHLYRTPLKSKRWYMRLCGYAIDVSLTNAWVICRRDCKALGVAGLSLKKFRLEVFRDARSQSCLTPEGAQKTSAPLLISPNLSEDTAANSQLTVCGLDLTRPYFMPLSSPLARPASTAAGRGTLGGQM